MNNKFDELAKNMAQSVTRRVALRRFGAGITGIALASIGLATKAEAAKGGKPQGSSCSQAQQCQADLVCCRASCDSHKGVCISLHDCFYGGGCW